MPPLKQPTPLQKIAIESFVDHIVNYCDRLSVAGELVRLFESIAIIKEYLYGYRPFFAELCQKFLDEFYRIGENRWDDQPGIYYGSGSKMKAKSRHNIGNRDLKRPDSHYRAAWEIMMDIDIPGLRCEGDVLNSLGRRDVHRLLGLEILDLSSLEHSRFEHLRNMRLQNLTTFIFPWHCTDGHLKIIGSRCPTLQVLIIDQSESVTDTGLRALRSCSELRVIAISHCNISNSEVYEMLSMHKKLEALNYTNRCGREFETEIFDISSRETSFACPSIERFAICSKPVTDRHLNALVALFPNLTHLKLCSRISGDIRILKQLSQLTVLDLNHHKVYLNIDHFKELLIDIGENISYIGLLSYDNFLHLKQEDLNFISKHCRNVETLEFYHHPTRTAEEFNKLIIPPFRKLKNLSCFGWDLDPNSMLYFCNKMLEVIEIMMFDQVQFPNLKEVRIDGGNSDHARRINQIAKNNNLDFSVKISGLSFGVH